MLTYMNNEVENYVSGYPTEIIEMYNKLRGLIYESTTDEIIEKLWSKLPSYYVGNRFVRLIPFKNHINVEASSALQYKHELSGYKFTPKGMLQIYIDQPVPTECMKAIFNDTLTEQEA